LLTTEPPRLSATSLETSREPAVDVIVDVVGYYEPAASTTANAAGVVGAQGPAGPAGVPGVAGPVGAVGPAGAAAIGGVDYTASTAGNRVLGTQIPTVMGSVALTTPSAGHVIVTGSVGFVDGAADPTNTVTCGLSTSTVFDGDQHTTSLAAAGGSATLSFSRGFQVAAGTTTVNLICLKGVGSSGTVTESGTTSLTGIFSATQL